MQFNTAAVKSSFESWKKSALNYEARSQVDNFRFEELVSAERLDAYEKKVANSNFPKAHNHYFRNSIKVQKGIPDCFMNNLNPASLGNIDEEQYIVRLEEINWVLKDEFTLEGIRDNLDIRQRFLEEWNGVRFPYLLLLPLKMM